MARDKIVRKGWPLAVDPPLFCHQRLLVHCKSCVYFKPANFGAHLRNLLLRLNCLLRRQYSRGTLIIKLRGNW